MLNNILRKLMLASHYEFTSPPHIRTRDRAISIANDKDQSLDDRHVYEKWNAQSLRCNADLVFRLSPLLFLAYTQTHLRQAARTRGPHRI